MNPLVFFDYVYYSMAALYGKRFGWEDVKEFSGIMILSLLEFANGLAIFIHLKPLKELSKFEILIVFILGNLLFLILNTIRYKKIVTYGDLEKKWSTEHMTRKVIKTIFVIVYIVLSFILLGI